MKTETQSKVYRGELFNTGKTWIFNNGQFGEVMHEKRRHCGELVPEFNRLHYWQENEGGQRLNSASLYIHSDMLKVYSDIVAELTKNI